ncbi:hypothetical protein F4561_005606 [Lipingzhangella halophila]|uniref:Uncharacterized protein n=1 Tax=Lipingzhangella halophila TaxID=1783352 RepID=A0A7W7RC11_9ACTN|nr:hypothetical protein [Lipingzhangella halophila]MBB4934712.1 hypothetical protein [Lipingzhangella halophila]
MSTTLTRHQPRELRDYGMRYQPSLFDDEFA